MSSPELEDLDALRAGNAALREEIERLASIEGARSPFQRGLVTGLVVSAMIVGLTIAAVVLVATAGV